jgi:TRAP-type C4-dicarboxylate transport system substrate-binding protein
MSGLTDTIQAANVMWYLYETEENISNEWAQFYVIECSAACGVPWTTTNKQITSASDFQGLRMRCVTPPVVNMIQELGCVPMSITISDTYENLEKNVADGCLNDWHNIKAFSLWDVLDYAMDVQVNYSNQALIMNWDSYNSLPDDLKAIIDEYSGEYAALMAGEYWESSVELSKQLGEESGVTIYEPNEEVLAAMEDAAEKGIQQWVDEMNSNGYDGDGIIAAYRNALELYGA